MRLHAPADLLPKLLLNALFDQEDDLLKPCRHRVIYRKINDQISMIVNRIDLFQSPIAASHPCRHDHKYWFFPHRSYLSSYYSMPSSRCFSHKKGSPSMARYAFNRFLHARILASWQSLPITRGCSCHGSL